MRPPVLFGCALLAAACTPAYGPYGHRGAPVAAAPAAPWAIPRFEPRVPSVGIYERPDGRRYRQLEWIDPRDPQAHTRGEVSPGN